MSSSRPRRTRRRPRPAALAVAVAAASLALAACSSPSPSSSGAAGSGAVRGDKISAPVTLNSSARADSFRTSTGATTSLGRLQDGKLMLVYFGYTHCPDVCPTTMADLGQALRQLPTQVQARTQVVFVTSDPERDTPPVMKAWLANFDASLVRPFVGLTSSLKQIDSVATSVGVPLEPPKKEKNGTITVQHGAQTLAFVDGKASVLWLAGTTAADYSHDIPMLAEQVTT